MMGNATRWVNCPICDEPDMPFEPEEQEPERGWGYITCLNLSCPSNSLVKVNDDRADLLDMVLKWRTAKKVMLIGGIIVFGFVLQAVLCIGLSLIF